LRLDIYEKYKLRESIPSQKKRSNTAKPANEEETTQKKYKRKSRTYESANPGFYS